MNWIVITTEDQISGDSVRIVGIRNQHIQKILKKKVSDKIRVIIPGSKKGIFEITKITTEFVEVIPVQLEEININHPFSEIEIFFALPRPQTGKKILHLCGTYGVGKLNFIFPHLKNKEYLTSPLYSGKEIEEIYDGMAQSGNPLVTKINYIRSNDSFYQLLKRNQVVIFDPRGDSFSKFCFEIENVSEQLPPTQFVFGPESGFVEEEIQRFREMELRILNLGNVILRTEYAFSAFLHQINSLLEANSSRN